MILTPRTLAEIPTALAAFEAGLGDAVVGDVGLARRALERIGATLAHVRRDDIALSTDADHHDQAVCLLGRFGLAALDQSPGAGLTWDGRAVAIDMEPSVIIHEVAHYQLAAPERRPLADFGMGAGPESGLKDAADRVCRLGGTARDIEEALVSLLGILWEAELEQPAILAFLEQNWLEGGASPHNCGHFIKIVTHLGGHGFIDEQARPTLRLRHSDDETFYRAFTG
jgi:hypothetical protein